jgi:hypothetical protein
VDAVVGSVIDAVLAVELIGSVDGVVVVAFIVGVVAAAFVDVVGELLRFVEAIELVVKSVPTVTRLLVVFVPFMSDPSDVTFVTMKMRKYQCLHSNSTIDIFQLAKQINEHNMLSMNRKQNQRTKPKRSS